VQVVVVLTGCSAFVCSLRSLGLSMVHRDSFLLSVFWCVVSCSFWWDCGVCARGSGVLLLFVAADTSYFVSSGCARCGGLRTLLLLIGSRLVGSGLECRRVYAVACCFCWGCLLLFLGGGLVGGSGGRFAGWVIQYVAGGCH